MPPSVARELVATSGPKQKPCGRRKLFRWSSTTPGPTRTVRRSRSRSVICAVVAGEIYHQPVADGPAGQPRARAAGNDRDARLHRGVDQGADLARVGGKRDGHRLIW